MVKLIRVTTQSNNGTFDTSFRSPVNVKEGSRIALQNLIMAVENKEIIIDDTNDQMFFSLSGGVVINVFLTRATYDKVNAQSGLLRDIADKLNAAIPFTGGKSLGCQWKVSFGTRLTIQNNFSKTSSYVTQFGQNAPAQAAGSNTRLVALSSGTNPLFVMSQNSLATGAGAARSDNEACNFLEQPICKGTGFWRAKIHTLIDDPSGNKPLTGFIIGLCKGQVSQFFQGNPPVSAGNFLDKDLFFAAHINLQATAIDIYKEGNPTASAFTPAGLGLYVAEGDSNNATIAVEVLGNVLRITAYTQATPAGTVIANMNSLASGANLNIGTQDYTPFIIYRGAHNNARTFKHQFIQDPYVTNPSDINEEHNQNLGAPTPPTQAGAKRLTKQEVGFTSSVLANELGYVPERFPAVESGLLEKLVWTADNDFEILTVNDNYMVIMDNHYLDSYDSLEKGQRSILAVLPVKDDIGAIRFDSNYPIYVDLNNKLPISMRNIKIRVIRADGTQVNSIGLSTATLLIEEK